ncbi:hypothetical protein QBC34DRAFT_210285 [Podospora aff. communis PSN243]|uniref:Extracellular membrane protein CFEM domain-containing protein n=1 Tax=Podospora aff. communis PSN243 TaxID=3040156 RepID=A0AAV9GXZ6_9PEZI|nr:hypothetical protein QBC34DRAFT_210285 [Podospora aff. communis PSN243]
MKTAAVAAILAPALANAQWWGGAPECAQQCFSSVWETASTWPAPTSYCGATQAPTVASCISSACSATPTAITSYSSLSASLCSRWESCSSAGSTGVLTISAPAYTGTGAWGPGGRWGPGGPGGEGKGPWGAEYTGTKTWTGGVYTVTGCEWNGSPWAGGPGGWGAGGLGGSPWGNWGAGWKWSTATQTVTQIITITTGGVTSFSTSIGLATVAQAVSGDITQTSIITDGSARPTGNAAPGGMSDVAGVKVMGALLGGVVAVAGML